MKVTCVNCKKSYKLSASQLPNSGRKVRCSNCGNVWLQMPPNVSVSTNVSQSSEQNNNQLIINQGQASSAEKPSEHSPKEQNILYNDSAHEEIVTEKAQTQELNNDPHNTIFSTPKTIIALAMVFVTLFLTGILFQESLPENLQKVYRILELYSTQGVILDDVRMTKFDEENNVSLKIEGIILNTSSKIRFLPNIYIYIQDASRHYLYKANVKNKIQSLKPGQKFQFSYVIDSIPKTADTLQCKIGNRLELWLH